MSFDAAHIEEGEFRYVEAGAGPPVLLLHGLFGAIENYARTVAHLASRHTVAVPDLPFYSLPRAETHLGAVADFLDRFSRHKGWQRMTIIGNSIGGELALMYAHAHPDRVRSLVLCGSSGLEERGFGGVYFRRADYEFVRQKVAMTFHDPRHVTKSLVDACYAKVNDRHTLARIVALARNSARRDLGHAIRELSVPVGLIWGRQDLVTPPHVAEEFHRRLPRSEIFWIDECGHVPMMEQPDAFNRALDRHWIGASAE